MKAPTQTLLVTDGRKTVGYISRTGPQRFCAQLVRTGEKFGPFKNRADAAQALSTARHTAEAANDEF